MNKSYVIIDSNELLKNPKKGIIAWCMKINIKFDKSMLRWKKEIM